MRSWIKQVPVADTKEDKSYFVARFYNNGNSFDFWSCYLSGKETWSVKPGIAIQYHGGESLIRTFAKNPNINLVAIEVPADANKRWKSRKHSASRKRN